LCEFKQLRKKEVTYKEWYLNVYMPIKKEIFKSLSNKNTINRAKSQKDLYYEYLKYVDKHGFTFREDYEKTKQDPTDLLYIHAKFDRELKDPTNLPQRKYFHEEKMIFRCLTGKNLTKTQVNLIKLPHIVNDNNSRLNLEWKDWLLDHYNWIHSEARIKSS
jgi:hypothetical protein